MTRLLERRHLPAMALAARHAATPDGSPTRPADAALSRTPATGDDPTPRTPVVPVPAMTLSPTRLARRLAHGRRREEQSLPRAVAPTLVRPVVAAAPPTAPTATPSLAEEPARSAARGPARHPAHPTPPAAAALPSPHQIEALTDHVVRRIDRRLVAWRERRGRV